jgi:hypothetical protein
MGHAFTMLMPCALRHAGATFAGSPADFGKFIDAETAKWAKVIREH